MTAANYRDITGRVIGHWSGGGGGGSMPGAERWIGPFPFAFDDVGLAAGVPFYTPTVGDWILDAHLGPIYDEHGDWNGTTPLGDIGYPGQQGFYTSFFGAVDMSTGPNIEFVTADDPAVDCLLALNDSNHRLLTNVISSVGGLPGISSIPPWKVLSATPLSVWVSQDGSAGGADPGADQGQGEVYLCVATPAAP